MVGDLYREVEGRAVRLRFEFNGEQWAESGISQAASQTARLETVSMIDSMYANAIR